MIRRKVTALATTLGVGVALTACADDPATVDAPDTVEGTAIVSATDSPAPDPVRTYVALGDSYAAMGSVASPNLGPEACHRSADNYPARVLADPRVEGRDVSCGGAVTDHLLQSLTLESGEVPPQVDALSEDVNVVTLSIGGNDIGFGDIVDCYVTAIQAGGPSDCSPALQSDVEAQLAQLPAKLDGVYDAIDDRAPNAKVIATGYMPLLAPGDECESIAAISEGDRAWVVSLTDELNRVVRDAAERHGATAVIPDGVEGHTGCAAPEQRWVDFFGMETGAYPMHPTPLGQTAMGEAVLAEL